MFSIVKGMSFVEDTLLISVEKRAAEDEIRPAVEGISCRRTTAETSLIDLKDWNIAPDLMAFEDRECKKCPQKNCCATKTNNTNVQIITEFECFLIFD